MTERGPAITVVIPAYKAEAFIARAVRSVLAQPDVRPEIIVVVDGIYDRTAEIACGFPGVTVMLTEQSRGAPAARNRALGSASAPYVLFLDSDDYVEGPLLGSLLEKAWTERLDVVFGPAVREWPDGTRGSMRRPIAPDSLEVVREWLLGHFVPCNAVLWSTRFIRRIGGWREDLIYNDDGELIFRGLLEGAKVGYAHGGVAIYVQHAGPERITLRRSIKAQLTNLEIGIWLLEQLRARNALTEPLRRALVTSFYWGIRRSYAWGHAEIAEDYAAQWRALGGSGHEGTVAHRLACQVLGLRRKEQIAAIIRQRLHLSERRAAAGRLL